MNRLSPAFPIAVIAVLLAGCDGSTEPRPIDFIDAQHEVVVERDVVYGSGEVRVPTLHQKELLLDLYRPSTPGVPAVRPGIVLIHGGSFQTGSKVSEPMPDMGERFAERGYVAVSINYRLMPDDPTTESFATDSLNPVKVAAAAARIDAALAVEWLRDHAAEYDVDPERIAVAGYSAGAVTANGIAYWQPGIQHADVRAVFSLSGGLHESEDSVDVGEPPLLLIHGAEDTAKGPHEALAARATEVGLTFEMHELPGINHQGARNLDNPLGSRTVWDVVGDFFFVYLDLASLL